MNEFIPSPVPEHQAEVVLSEDPPLTLALAEPVVDPEVQRAAEQYVRTKQRRRHPLLDAAMVIASSLAAALPPRETARVVVGPNLKTPERLSAAQAKRQRKAAKRLRDGYAKAG